MAICALIAYTASGAAWAQPPTGAGGSIFETRPSERRAPLPEFEKPGEAPELELPPAKPPPTEGLPFAIRIFVREFRITGNTVFTTEELKKVVAPFENRHLNNNDFEEVRQRLTIYYINRGYINSGAVIPDQKVTDDTIEIRIIEGRLERIDIEGTKKFKPKFFTSRLEPHAGPPLNVKNLEQELQILLQDPLVEQINAQLKPGDRPGEAVLTARIKEARPYDFGLVLDNKIPPSLGEARLLIQGELRNLAGRGDTLFAELGLAEGIDGDLKFRYRLPLTPKDLTLNVYYENGDAKVVEEPFNVLDIETELETIGIQIGQLVYRTPNKQLLLAALFEHRETETFLLGQPFSFSPGVQNGKAEVSVVRFVQDWVGRGRNQVISARSTISIGTDSFGATINETGPDGEFVSWIPQFQWVRRFGGRGHQLSFRFEGQISSAPLLPIEKFVVGGLDSVRGYRTNQLVRDEGYSASLQYQVPIFRNPSGLRNLQFAAFIDNGSAKNKIGPNPGSDTLTGVGVGLIWNPTPKFSGELYIAEALDDVPEPGEKSLQDDGIYFRLVGHPFWTR